MSDTTQDLVTRAAEVGDCTDRLREALERFKEAIAGLAQGVQDGQPAVDALEAVGGSLRRQELTDMLEEFEAARHRIRVALFALAMEQGASISEIGRRLGISRQLASRLATEVQPR